MLRADPRKIEQRSCAKALQPITNQDDVPSIIAIGCVSAQQQEQNSRQKQSQSGIAKIDRSMRNCINLPRHRDRLRFGSNNDKQPRQLISTKIAGGKCGSAASRLVRNRHSFYRVTVSHGHAFGWTFWWVIPLLARGMNNSARGSKRDPKSQTALSIDAVHRASSRAVDSGAYRDSVWTPHIRSPPETILATAASLCPTSPLAATPIR
jgi:hypothetical protein